MQFLEYLIREGVEQTLAVEIESAIFKHDRIAALAACGTDGEFDREEIVQMYLDWIKEWSGLDACPFCKKFCHYFERDTWADGTIEFRVGVYCNKTAEADDGSAMGNDFGRSNWNESLDKSIAEWNAIRKQGEDKGSHSGVW